MQNAEEQGRIDSIMHLCPHAHVPNKVDSGLFVFVSLHAAEANRNSFCAYTMQVKYWGNAVQRHYGSAHFRRHNLRNTNILQNSEGKTCTL